MAVSDDKSIVNITMILCRLLGPLENSLLNEPHVCTGINDTNRMKIYNYNVYQLNKSGEENAGVAIEVKLSIMHKIIDDFQKEFLANKIETSRGPITIATAYVPSRHMEDFPIKDLTNIMRKKEQVLFLGDLNARAPFVGHRDTNFAGRLLTNLKNRNIITHVGPDFNNFVHMNPNQNISRPDIVICNRHFILNKELKRGKLMTADHFSITMRFSSLLLIKAKGKTYLFRKANW